MAEPVEPQAYERQNQKQLSERMTLRGSGRCGAFLMMLPLMAFEALSLRSHAPYFLIEHINLALERASLDCFASSPRILFRVFSTESLWISAIMPASVKDETTSDNICAPAHFPFAFSSASWTVSSARNL